MKVTDFYNISEESLTKKLLDWQKSVFQAASSTTPGISSTLKYRGQNPLDLLPYKQQTEFMGQYREIIGLNSVLRNMMGQGSRTERVGNIWGGLRSIMGMGSKNPYGMFRNIEDSGNPVLDRIYREMRLQFNDYPKLNVAGISSRTAPDAIHHFGVGISSIPVFSESYGNQTRKIAPNSRYMTFDIETAGFMKNQIREVSFASGVVGSAGQFNTASRSSEFFEASQFGRGSMGIKDTDGRVMPVKLGEFMKRKFGIGPSASADAFAERMIPFLNQVNNVDYVIGHNIGGFDIEQVFTQLASSKKYGSDAQFRALVDKSFEALKPGSGKVLDTLQLARTASNLADISLAPELEAIGRGGPYSIENLLLQTNLAEKIGLSNTRKLLSAQGLHAGSVDLEITNAVAQHLHELVPQQLGGSTIANAIRQSVLSSAAITPHTDIRAQGDIADSVLRTLIDTGTGIENTGRNLKNLLNKAAAGDTAAGQKAFDRIRSNRYRNLRFNINPIEHEVLATRNLGMAADVTRQISSDDLMMNAGAFARATGTTGHFYSSNGLAGFQQARLLGSEEMSSFQSELARRNMPFAGLSFEERRLGTSLASVTSQVPGTIFDSNLGVIGNDIMVSNFELFDPDHVAYLTRSGRTSMPAALLQKAGILSDGTSESASMLSLSSVEPTELYPHRGMNLVYNFTNQDQLDTLASHLESLRGGTSEDIAEALGYDRNNFSSGAVERFRGALSDGLIDSIRSEGLARGVSIGQLGGQAAEQVNDILKEVSGLDRLSDKSMMAFRLPFMQMDISESTATGVIRTAGAVLDRGLDSEGLNAVSKSVQHTRNVFEAFKTLSADSGKVVSAKTIAGATDGAQVAKVISAYNKFQEHIRPNMGKATLGVLALGLGAHLWQKHEEAKKYDATVAPMPTDRRRYAVADQLQTRIDSGYNGYYQHMDPLATASLVDVLNENKIGHTNMDPNRYSNLYAGVL